MKKKHIARGMRIGGMVFLVFLLTVIRALQLEGGCTNALVDVNGSENSAS